jgi:epidermal growth factor receptor substrate 15
MHLVYRALERNPVPLALPVEMIPPSKRLSLPSVSERSGITSVDTVQELPVNQGLENALLGGSMILDPANPKLTSLTITPSEKVKYDELFRRADTDMDGLVNGLEIKDIFLQTGLPQMTLAHIWLVLLFYLEQ